LSEQNVERRLATILMADVVEYSRLMEENEAAVLHSLQEHQFALINPTIGQYHGRVVKLMGDGILVEFQSVVDAVECAIAIQSGMISRNETVPEARKIKFRIGMNLGDVLIDGDDIYGDGINIAARLEALAEPNGIMISSNIYSLIEGSIDQSFSDAGAHKLKNISKVVRAYQYNPSPTMQSQKTAFRPFVDMPENEMPLATGGCLCGKVRYEVSSKALGSMLCHCHMCQRYSGAPMLEGATFPTDAFKLTSGKLKVYKSSDIAERSFCGDCGSPILYQGRIGYWTKWVVVTTGSFDEPEKYPPTYHLGVESQLSWVKLVDDLPKTTCRDSPSLVEAYKSVGQKVP
jgi:adenylate cyclase